MQPPRYILPIIVFAQFCCTSLWFASNGVLDHLIQAFELPTTSLGYLTSAVQFGFIIGTLVFASLMLVDRYSPAKVFFISAILGSICNLAVILESNTLMSLLLLRLGTGFFLAGIYPVGMKIASDYYEKGLGKSLGFLVGALVLGTAFPHVLGVFESQFPWKWVMATTSVMALVGGLSLYLFVPNGPFRRKSDSLQWFAFITIFKNRPFRKAAFGYFGHMWELYAFWAFVPVLLATYNSATPNSDINIPLWSFLIVAIGSLGCVSCGLLSSKIGTSKLASAALFSSFLCCLFVPMMFTLSAPFFILFLLFWGFVVIADSPLFSTLVAQSATSELKGTALTITNCIGFAITIVSIQLLAFFLDEISSRFGYMILAIGPFIGLLVLRNQSRKHSI